MGESSSEEQIWAELDKIYNSPDDAGSYGGVEKLLSAAKDKGLKVNRKIIKKYLANQASYSLHKQARKNFTRNPTVVRGIDQQWQGDLADMQAISGENKGTKFLLTIIDVFSKFAWVIPVKNKSGKEILGAFKELLQQASPRKPEKIQTDKGKEFLNKDVQSYLITEGIKHFCSDSDKKAAVVERFNRTLKTKIWKYFTGKQTYTYIDKLTDFVKAYNHSYHRSIGMRPCDVTTKDEDKIWAKLYGSTNNPGKKKVSLVGRKARISKVKGVFEKGYVPNWSEEHFHVKQRLGKRKPVYKLLDDLGDDIKGQFYEEELQPIEENRYLIEKVLKRRKVEGKGECFVKWKGWPAKFNSWVKDEDVEDI
ncbi:MAG: putative uncharacterized transposon-derived protein F54H12.3-like [Ignavibacteria bacterium]|nr:MAG: putative uncharacterized transposon-derived protein F54H12.3-like [Ignavibacteria bacterium]